MKDPIELLLPSSNLVFVIFHAEEPADQASFSQVDDFPLDPGYSSAIGALANEWIWVRIVNRLTSLVF